MTDSVLSWLPTALVALTVKVNVTVLGGGVPGLLAGGAIGLPDMRRTKLTVPVLGFICTAETDHTDPKAVCDTIDHCMGLVPVAWRAKNMESAGCENDVADT